MAARGEALLPNSRLGVSRIRSKLLGRVAGKRVVDAPRSNLASAIVASPRDLMFQSDNHVHVWTSMKSLSNN